MKPAHLVQSLSLSVVLLAGVTGFAYADEHGAAAKAAPSAATSQALNDASAAIEKAKSVNWIWRDTEDTLAKAQEAAKKGDDAAALKLAKTAKNEAELAVNQYYLEHAKAKMRAVEAEKGRLSAEGRSVKDQMAKAIASADGKKAYDLSKMF